MFMTEWCTMATNAPPEQAVTSDELNRMAEWMDAELGLTGPLVDVTPITGGTQNILLRFRKGAHEYVLRRPPRNKRDNSDATMFREARVLAALETTSVPHPRLVGCCADLAVMGAAFYLMCPVDGINPAEGVPEQLAHDASRQRALGLAMADGAAALGNVDVIAF